MEVECRRRGMVTWADADAAIEAEREARWKRVETTTLMTALSLLVCAVWLAWPSLKGLVAGEGVALTAFGAPLLLVIWGIFIQDLTLDDPAARTRVGSASALAWPVLLVIGALGVEAALTQQLFGSVLIMLVALVLRNAANATMRGHFGVLRYRAMLTGIGTASAAVLALTQTSTLSYLDVMPILALSMVALSAVDTVYSWTVGDDQKAERKAFRKRLDRLEIRLLELKAQGAAVAQAASLLTTAKEEGHLDPEYGMRLLDASEEDMERSLSLADDVEIIRLDALQAVDEAEAIAPAARRPRKAYDMGVREVSLGSLREGEQLYRQAKKRATEILTWWKRAEEAITEATRALDGRKGDGIAALRDLLSEAKEKLANEHPKEAYEFAMVIPGQLEADEGALERAEEALGEARRHLKQSDGLDTTLISDRLEQAQTALDNGNASQAIGLADGVVRTIERERAAMDDVLRALKQKKNLVKRFEGRDDEATWRVALDEIIEAADTRQWSHAGMLLERMTAGLDKEGQASDDALELYDFVMDQWRVLRNQCEAVSIGVQDDDRRVRRADLDLQGPLGHDPDRRHAHRFRLASQGTAAPDDLAVRIGPDRGQRGARRRHRRGDEADPHAHRRHPGPGRHPGHVPPAGQSPPCVRRRGVGGVPAR